MSKCAVEKVTILEHKVNPRIKILSEEVTDLVAWFLGPKSWGPAGWVGHSDMWELHLQKDYVSEHADFLVFFLGKSNPRQTWEKPCLQEVALRNFGFLR